MESAASAHTAEDGAAIYPGTCRDRYRVVEAARLQIGVPAVRFKCAMSRSMSFAITFAGSQQFDPQRQLGDFVIAKADGTPAYQLAVGGAMMQRCASAMSFAETISWTRLRGKSSSIALGTGDYDSHVLAFSTYDRK